jgi:hypothetical protein
VLFVIRNLLFTFNVIFRGKKFRLLTRLHFTSIILLKLYLLFFLGLKSNLIRWGLNHFGGNRWLLRSVFSFPKLIKGYRSNSLSRELFSGSIRTRTQTKPFTLRCHRFKTWFEKVVQSWDFINFFTFTSGLAINPLIINLLIKLLFLLDMIYGSRIEDDLLRGFYLRTCKIILSRFSRDIFKINHYYYCYNFFL